jgi:ABC-type dipeptide/oligopeptide/nickel transport system ATPase component
MRNGRPVEEGTAADVLERPRDPYTAALLNASPAFAGEEGLAGAADGR